MKRLINFLQNTDAAAIKSYSVRAIVSSICMSFISVIVLMIGISLGGAGHGTTSVWILGLALSLAAWLVLGLGLMFAVRSRFLGARFEWWFFLAALAFVVITLVGVWGIQG